MNKLVPTLGVAGAGTAAAGGYLLSNLSSSDNVSTVKSKYKKSLLDIKGGKDSGIGDSKFSALKEGNSNHPDLQKASKDKDATLHKNACQSIYDSSFESNEYLDDFKNYCARLVEDVVFWNGIDEDSESESPGNGSLQKLKSKKGNLISEELKELANKLPTDSDTFIEENRKQLREWCLSKRKEFSMDVESKSILDEIQSYCAS